MYRVHMELFVEVIISNTLVVLEILKELNI